MLPAKNGTFPNILCRQMWLECDMGLLESYRVVSAGSWPFPTSAPSSSHCLERICDGWKTSGHLGWEVVLEKESHAPGSSAEKTEGAPFPNDLAARKPALGSYPQASFT